MRYAVVTGGTGFIGAHLVQDLVLHGYHVFVLTRNSKECELTLPKNSDVTYVLYDSFQYTALQDLEGDIELFYHLAWDGVSTEDKNDSELQVSNITFSLKMLEFAHKIGAKKFIAAGTVAEYVFCQNIMDFNLRQSPNDMYGASKTATHYLLEVKARLLGQPFIWAVLPSTFGEGRRDNNIITYTIMSLLKGEMPKYGNLEQMWDFLYISELVRALRFIGEKGICDKTYGIGSGIYRPLYSYIEEIRDIINPELPLGIGAIPQYSQQTFSSCVGIYDIAKDTGWYPNVSFREGIIKTVEYYRQRM